MNTRRSFLATLLALLVPGLVKAQHQPPNLTVGEAPITQHPAWAELRVKYQWSDETKSFPPYLDRGSFFKKERNPMFGVTGFMTASQLPKMHRL